MYDAYNKKRSKDLTVRQLKFCQYYLQEEGDIKSRVKTAAVAAGYSERCAWNSGNYILNQPHVQKFIRKHMKEIEKKVGDLLQWKTKKLVQITEICVPGDQTEGIDPKDINATAAISAIAELNKMHGDYAPTKTINALLTADVDKEQLDYLIEQHKREF